MVPDPSYRSGHAKGRLQRWILSVILALGALIFLELAFGRVTGSEFSPDRFERRTFTYYQIPWLQVQISPAIRDDVTNELERYVRRKKLISASPVSRQWDVVSLSFAADRGAENGQAQILCRYLDLQDAERNPWWLKWSQEHPEHAQSLWEAVQQAAQLDAYFFVPELFDLALRTEDADEFSRQLNAWLTQQYSELAADCHAAGRTIEAEKYQGAAETRADRVSRQGSAEVPPSTKAFP